MSKQQQSQTVWVMQDETGYIQQVFPDKVTMDKYLDQLKNEMRALWLGDNAILVDAKDSNKVLGRIRWVRVTESLKR